jgi:membrane protease YdiL (CAAX protease family)
MRSSTHRLSFRQEFADFWRFLKRPDLRRLPGRRAGSGLGSDWWPGVPLGRVLAWAAVLWLLNFILLGPLAVLVATSAGASHRMDPATLPWFTAVIWAPFVEEMLFRYGLRRPRQALWLCPAMLPPLLWGAQGWTFAWLAGVLALACLPLRAGRQKRCGWRMDWRRYYRWKFPLVFHLSALTFAAVHLHNFRLADMAYWMLPLLVLPQWSAGLVIGWMRVRRGIGAAILLHGLFNAGPLLIITLVLSQTA